MYGTQIRTCIELAKETFQQRSKVLRDRKILPERKEYVLKCDDMSILTMISGNVLMNDEMT